MPYVPTVTEDVATFTTEGPKRSLEDVWTPEYEPEPIFMTPERGSGFEAVGYGVPGYAAPGSFPGGAQLHGAAAAAEVHEATLRARRFYKKTYAFYYGAGLLLTAVAVLAALLSMVH